MPASQRRLPAILGRGHSAHAATSGTNSSPCCLVMMATPSQNPLQNQRRRTASASARLPANTSSGIGERRRRKADRKRAERRQQPRHQRRPHPPPPPGTRRQHRDRQRAGQDVDPARRRTRRLGSVAPQLQRGRQQPQKDGRLVGPDVQEERVDIPGVQRPVAVDGLVFAQGKPHQQRQPQGETGQRDRRQYQAGAPASNRQAGTADTREFSQRSGIWRVCAGR